MKFLEFFGGNGLKWRELSTKMQNTDHIIWRGETEGMGLFQIFENEVKRNLVFMNNNVHEGSGVIDIQERTQKEKIYERVL